MPMQIPLDAGAENADTSFLITIEGVVYTMRLQYKTLVNAWTLSIFQEDEPVAVGLRLVRGCDLLSAYLFFKYWSAGCRWRRANAGQFRNKQLFNMDWCQ